ncbi:MAG: hypothetical protein EXR52_02690 [Dehalococcoidia bacterium]|nr:hypothetical protein [Dehalococcoidia bacterium]
MRRLSLVLALVLVLLAPAPLSTAAPRLDDPITVTVTADVTTVRTGDQVKLRVSVAHAAGVKLQFPEPATLQSRTLEVLRVQAGQGARSLTGEITTTTEYVLAAFAPGDYPVPDVRVGYETADGMTGAVTATHGIRLTVESVLASQPNASLQDIRPPLGLPLPPGIQVRPIAQVALALALPLLALLLLRRLLRNRRVTLVPIAVLSPEARVRGALQEAAALLNEGAVEFAVYYTLLSTAVRAYLEERTDLPALSSTTRELRRRMELHGTDKWHARVILSLLDECDAVKWAHAGRDLARAQRAMTMAYEVVDLVEAAATPQPPPSLTLTPVGGPS